MTKATDWKEWLRRWDEQQESFNRDRDRRFSAMFDIVQATQGRAFRALDLGSGPGSLSARLLGRFPRARSVAVDYDPVALRVGMGALGTFGGRLRWVDVKLGRAGWDRALPTGQYDAALSTTALHWLTVPELRRLYRDLARRIRRGGVVLNGDYLPWGRGRVSRMAERVRKIRTGSASSGSEWKAWERWWRDAERVPELRPLFRVREERHSAHPQHRDSPLGVHVRALRDAGFAQVDVVWQDMENRVLCALR